MSARTIRITTLSSAATGDGDDRCDDQRTCPGVHTLADRPGLYYVVVTQVTDADELAAFAAHLGPGEMLGTAPRAVIDGGSAMTLLDEHALGDFIDTHYRGAGDRLFRMERLPRYDVPHQTAELARWRDGATEPNWETKQPWLDRLAEEQRRGLVSQRVRRFGRVLSDDELRACHWGYALNGRYEDIRVLREGEHDIPAGMLEVDYWIVADRFAVPMHYDDEGRFRGAEVVPSDRLAGFLSDRDRAWRVAEPFTDWWARHPELHRDRVA